MFTWYTTNIHIVFVPNPSFLTITMNLFWQKKQVLTSPRRNGYRCSVAQYCPMLYNVIWFHWGKTRLRFPLHALLLIANFNVKTTIKMITIGKHVGQFHNEDNKPCTSTRYLNSNLCFSTTCKVVIYFTVILAWTETKTMSLDNTLRSSPKESYFPQLLMSNFSQDDGSQKKRLIFQNLKHKKWKMYRYG